ncbi:MAG: anaerobic ribonucleoside-triphosphate reductase activating protein [Fusicatenibacter sp.]|nr:anaerobic ribonucleoside-triphosphate reductase activating protein [Lachnospiraceae bacterium]MDY2937071.1 anaerobic ribonucleoside-triphosphate reductase activating protein [Fusicatenibacter sp.]
MKIHGFQKLTLLDYPGKVACTVFTGGCNFRCPFCHNGNLVQYPQLEPLIDEEEVFFVLNKRKGILDGVCVTGGEPTLDEGLTSFVRKVKEMGFLVKLDTNGYRPEVLKSLVKQGLLDYVAMDIKNAPARYGETAGVTSIDLLKINESVEFLKSGAVDYEFRTTVTRELHGKAEFEAIGKWLAGAKRYFLQNYRESEQVIHPVFSGYSKEQLEQFCAILDRQIEQVEIRGVD